jgi:hypothetical protein
MWKRLIIGVGVLVAIGSVMAALFWLLPPAGLNSSLATENGAPGAPVVAKGPADRASGPAAQVGVYYFPGWRGTADKAPEERPWFKIKPFKEREPLQGWYQEGDVDVMQQQLAYMAGAGISFVAFDWYFGTDNLPSLDHAINAYLKAPNKSRVQFSLLWANHTGSPNSMNNFNAMLDLWLSRYMNQPEMLKIDGKPVVFVFSPAALAQDAAGFGTTPEALLKHAQERARAKGLPGIYFVVCLQSDDELGKTVIKPDSGYSAISAYNLHWLPGAKHPSHSFAELDAAFQSHWKRYRSLLPMPLIVPMMAGWDKRPWGGSEDDPLHDNSVGTPDEFEAHLKRGQDEIYRSPAGEPRLGVICCWNEFGEGSFIEPTRQMGTALIDRVRKVFAPAPAKTN